MSVTQTGSGPSGYLGSCPGCVGHGTSLGGVAVLSRDTVSFYVYTYHGPCT